MAEVPYNPDIEPRQPEVPKVSTFQQRLNAAIDKGRGQALHSIPQVDHPSHYNQSEMEVIDQMLALFGYHDVIAFCKLNAYKYRMRAGYKGDAAEDIEKAKWYENKMRELKEK